MKRLQVWLLSCMLVFASTIGVYAQESNSQPNQTQTQETNKQENKPNENKEENKDEKKEESQEKEEEEQGFHIQSAAGILLDMNSGKILYKKHEEDHYPQGSLNKLLGVSMAFSSLDQKEPLTMSPEAFKSYDHAKGVLWIQLNETLPCKDVEYAALLADANDAMAMLAEGVSKNPTNFLKEMNKKAASYGMNDTRYSNIFGLNDEDNYSSCKDIAKLLVEANKNPNFKQCFETRSYKIEPTNLQMKERIIVNDCPLLDKGNDSYDESVLGAKMGHTDKGGYVVAATANKNGLNLAAVVMGGKDILSANKDVKEMLNYGFSMFQTVHIKASDIGTKKVSLYWHRIHVKDIVFSVDSDFNVLLPSDIDPNNFTSEIEVLNRDSNDADKIEGEVVFKYGEKEVGRAKMEKKVKNTTPKLMQRFLQSGTPILDIVSVLTLMAFIFIIIAAKIAPPAE